MILAGGSARSFKRQFDVGGFFFDHFDCFFLAFPDGVPCVDRALSLRKICQQGFTDVICFGIERVVRAFPVFFVGETLKAFRTQLSITKQGGSAANHVLIRPGADRYSADRTSLRVKALDANLSRRFHVQRHLATSLKHRFRRLRCDPIVGEGIKLSEVPRWQRLEFKGPVFGNGDGVDPPVWRDLDLIYALFETDG